MSPKATNQRYKGPANGGSGVETAQYPRSSVGSDGGGGRLARVQAQLFGSSPLLEAMGNAQTERNDNSSRFGKYLELQFDWGGGVVGGKVTSYLLEKSRVVSHSPLERSFHVFYQWCAGALDPSPLPLAAAACSKGPLRDAARWRYLRRASPTIAGVDDAAVGRDVAAAMAAVGIDASQRRVVSRVLGAVLALGEVEFEDDAASVSGTGASSGGAQVTKASAAWLEEAAHLLGLVEEPPPAVADGKGPLPRPATSYLGADDAPAMRDQASADRASAGGRLLERALTTHTVEFAVAGAASTAGATGGASTLIVKQLGPEAAAANADTLAKEAYKRLFLWVIDRINDGTDAGAFAAQGAATTAAAATNGSTNGPMAKKRGNRSAAFVEGKDYASLGVLDIYGFEVLGTNGFEQLCINYANERLQQLAIALTLKAEQAEYVAEGIGWAEVAYLDNLAVVALVDKPRGGLFALLDEAGTLRGNPSGNINKEGTLVDPRDAGFATSVMREFGIPDDHGSSSGGSGKGAGAKDSAGVAAEAPATAADAAATASGGLVVGPAVRKRESFCVQHYAGWVEYRYSGFVARNEDSLFRDLVSCLAEHSSCAHVRRMWTEELPVRTKAAVAAGRGASSGGGGSESPVSKRPAAASSKKPPSVGAQFKDQVGLLVATLSAAKPHYVRCVKPNNSRKPRTADAQLLLHQVGRATNQLAVF